MSRLRENPKPMAIGSGGPSPSKGMSLKMFEDFGF